MPRTLPTAFELRLDEDAQERPMDAAAPGRDGAATGASGARRVSGAAQAKPLALGPVVCGTVVCPSLPDALERYAALDLRCVREGRISAETAARWLAPGSAGWRCATLRSESGCDWLRLVEAPDFSPEPAIGRHGWMALEVLVADVSAIAGRVQAAGFEVIGPPQPLAVNAAIVAMQVLGPGGEMLYLTEVGAEAPPFELPTARCAVDRLFIAVLSAPDRARAAAHYAAAGAAAPLRFDTRIGVVNRHFGYPPDTEHPVATVQLAGESLIEIDELADARPARGAPDRLGPGIAMVSIRRRAAPATGMVERGVAGERIEWLAGT